jgi:hypothetical protein
MSLRTSAAPAHVGHASCARILGRDIMNSLQPQPAYSTSQANEE